ncbi:MAG: hypothetical protein V4557_12635 [Bacteroidota bacterium]
MEYYKTEDAKKLGRAIELYADKNEFANNKDNDLQAENTWGASQLFAEILFHSKEQANFVTNRDTLDLINKQFYKETGIAIDVDAIINKGFLRIVYGLVRIPRVFISAIYEVENFKDILPEYQFLVNTKKEIKSGKGIAVADFDSLASVYESLNDVSLKIPLVKQRHLVKEASGFVTIQNIEYYKPLIDNFGDFQFLKSVYDFIYKDNLLNKLTISKRTCNAIIKKHKAVYPDSPGITEMVKRKMIIHNGSNYIVHVNHRTSEFDRLVLNKTGGILWRKVLASKKFTDDVHRLRFWYNRMLLKSSGWPETTSCFDDSAKEKFIAAAFEVVSKDPDLAKGEQEFRKLIFDMAHSRLDHYEYGMTRSEDDFPATEEPYELYRRLSELDDEFQGELLYVQEARYPLTFLLKQIVLGDQPFNSKRETYPFIFRLLKNGSKKPYLLWQTCFDIFYFKPSLMPFLLADRTYASLGLSLLWEVKLKEEIIQNSDSVRTEMIAESFSYLADNIDYLNEDKKLIARSIFQCLVRAVKEKFRIPRGQDTERQNSEKEAAIKLFNELKLVVGAQELPGSHSGKYSPYKKLAYVEMLPFFLSALEDYKDNYFFNRSSISIPFEKLDMLSWLLRLSLTDEYTSNVSQNKEEGTGADIAMDICKGLRDVYLRILNLSTIETWDHELKSFQPRPPLWQFNPENIRLIEWPLIFISLEKRKLLDDLLQPGGLRFRENLNEYDEGNRYVAAKMRTHLFILLHTYRALGDKSASLYSEKDVLAQVLLKIETAVQTLIVKYSSNDTSAARINILDKTFEQVHFYGENATLLPLIATDINSFGKERRNAIINALLETDKIERAYTLVNHLIDENKRNELKTIIQKQNIEDYIDGNYKLELDVLLEDMIQDDDFVNDTEKVLAAWRKRTARMPDSRQYKERAFKIELLLAYYKNDLALINTAVAPPKKENYGSSLPVFNAEAEKDFYRALYYLKNKEPLKAYRIFDAQVKDSNDDRPVLALNRFASKLKHGDTVEAIPDRQQIYAEAIDEWNLFEKNLAPGTTITQVRENVLRNKLYVYSQLKSHDNFDETYGELLDAEKLNEGFLRLRITNLIARQLIPEAQEQLRHAKTYHQSETGEYPAFIQELKDICDSKEDIGRLKTDLQFLLSKSPEVLAQIIPDNVNRYKELSMFLLFELVRAADGMLTKINSVSSIDHEDKFSDLIILGLDAKLALFHWHTGDPRAGFADSYSRNPGELDFAIFDAGNDKICICEGMILSGKNTAETQKHNFKIFNYGHARRHMYMLVYYTGEAENFVSAWEKYKTAVSEVVKFPDKYPLRETQLDELDQFSRSESIKVAKGSHGPDTLLYHIFININYKQEKPVKKAKKKAAKKKAGKKIK